MKTLLLALVSSAVRVLPWEQVTAVVLTKILEMVKTGNADILSRVIRFTKKIAEQLAILVAALDDGKITVEEAHQVMSAWADQKATPPIASTVTGE